MKNRFDHQWQPEMYAENARFVSDLGMPVLNLLAPEAGEKLLDLGCGDGALTLKLIQAGCDVIGIDSSPEMIQAARDRGVQAHLMDGQELNFDHTFDAVFSNAALHWMKDHHALLRGVRQALKPGGRFVAEFGGHGNVAAIVKSIERKLASRNLEIINPWYFPKLPAYEALLKRHQFEVNRIELIPRPTELLGDLIGWLQVFAQSFISVLPEEQRIEFLAEVVDDLRPVLMDENGQWYADYVRLRFKASIPVDS